MVEAAAVGHNQHRWQGAKTADFCGRFGEKTILKLRLCG
jgi:hypothetical protein